MKKIALSIALVMASNSVMADTYFRLGAGQANANLSATASNTFYKEGSSAVEMSESFENEEFKSNDVTIGIGQDFNEYISGELRYSLGLNNSNDDVSLHQEGVNEYKAITYNLYDGPVFNEQMTIEQKNRAEGLLLFKTPKMSGLQPYILVGYSMSNIKAGNQTFDVSGVTYGAGLDFDFDNNWSLSLEYQVFPDASGSHSSETDFTSDTASSSDTETKESSDESEHINKENYTYDFDSSRAMLSFAYRF